MTKKLHLGVTGTYQLKGPGCFIHFCGHVTNVLKNDLFDFLLVVLSKPSAGSMRNSKPFLLISWHAHSFPGRTTTNVNYFMRLGYLLLEAITRGVHHFEQRCRRDGRRIQKEMLPATQLFSITALCSLIEYHVELRKIFPLMP
jgi:hypothetical protein